MKRDIRNPSVLGEKLLNDVVMVRSHYGAGIPLTEVWDLHVSKFIIPDYVDATTLEKYGPTGKIEPKYARIQVR